MKRTLALILALCLLAPLCTAAADGGTARAVIGADLNEEQTAGVYAAFGVERGSVTELTVTNADEREYLDGLVDSGVLGTHAISCAYVELLPEGSGLEVTAENVNWCTPEMYVSALATAGITDARVKVAAPFAVSGTAALTGVYLAYEDITGEELSEEAKRVSSQELTVTASLSDSIGSLGSVEIINELKLLLDETRDMTDEELRAEIARIAAEAGVELNGSQVGQLVTLCRALEKLDPDALREKVQSVQETLQSLGAALEKAGGFFQRVMDAVSSVIDFFRGLFN
ncbi:MAG TPA: DUF1002 domain-containing protein [Candidatus Scatomorpha stercorigallinarum]|nr:DUF1002 domain-containing protein [Candidatus Scatomorpha stercorigallinarum]